MSGWNRGDPPKRAWGARYLRNPRSRRRAGRNMDQTAPARKVSFRAGTQLNHKLAIINI
jgi:hypothetical protein